MTQKSGHTEADVGVSSILTRSLSGEIFVIREFLQKIGAHGMLRNTLLSAVRELAGDAASARLDSAGFGRLHELFPICEIPGLIRRSETLVRRCTPGLFARVMREGFRYRDPVWLMRRPIVRYSVPYHLTIEHQEVFGRFREQYGEARATPIRPHRDTWYAEPWASINIWIALGTVKPGNGISIYCDDYASALHYVRDQGVTRSQPVTRPWCASLQEGDALIFHGVHLHASELNVSDLTRSTVSIRLSLQDPSLTSHAPKRYRRVVPARLSSFYQLHPNKTVARLAERLDRILPKIPDGMSTALPGMPQSRDIVTRDAGPAPAPELREVRVSSMVAGQPLAVSDEHCLVKILIEGEPQYWLLNRRCPHEGSDLAMGHVDGRVIRCPWHNMPIDVPTGGPGCPSLGPVQSRRCEVRDGTINLEQALGTHRSVAPS